MTDTPLQAAIGDLIDEALASHTKQLVQVEKLTAMQRRVLMHIRRMGCNVSYEQLALEVFPVRDNLATWRTIPTGVPRTFAGRINAVLKQLKGAGLIERPECAKGRADVKLTKRGFECAEYLRNNLKRR
jgi:hypothetical protein